MKLRKLPPDVVSKLRSGVAIVSIAHCTEELVLNALDAEATAVAVRLNLPYRKVQVVDNGHGMSREQLVVCGERHCTSKCRSMTDLERPKFYGYRGEALASLAEMSSGLQIESRTAESDSTYFKVFTRGKAYPLARSSQSRPSVGTTITVTDFMYNLPVRQKCVSESIDLEFCLQMMEGIALCHPNVSFTLRNDITGEVCFQTHKTNSVLETFALLFGRNRASALKQATYSEKKFSIKAYLSTDSHSSKHLQFVYLNERLLLKTRIHKMINNVLKKYLLRSKSGLPSSPSKIKNRHAIFIVFLKCTSRTYDITFEPKKTMVEFADWDAVTKALECLLGSFLRDSKVIDHNIVISGDFVYSQRTPEKPECNPSFEKAANQIRVEDFRNALLSKRVSRLRRSGSAEDVGTKQGIPKYEHEAPIVHTQNNAFVEEVSVLPVGTGCGTRQPEAQCKTRKLPTVSIALPPSYSDASKNRGRLSLPAHERRLDISKFSFQKKQPPPAKQHKSKGNSPEIKQFRHMQEHSEKGSYTSLKSQQVQSLGEATAEKMDDIREHSGEDSSAFFQELAEERNCRTSALRERPVMTRDSYGRTVEKSVTFAEPCPYFVCGTTARTVPLQRACPENLTSSQGRQNSTTDSTPIAKRLRLFTTSTSTSRLQLDSPNDPHNPERKRNTGARAYLLHDQPNLNSGSLKCRNDKPVTDAFIRCARDILHSHTEPGCECKNCSAGTDSVPNKILRLNDPAFSELRNSARNIEGASDIMFGHNDTPFRGSSIDTMEEIQGEDEESVYYEAKCEEDSSAVILEKSVLTPTTQPFSVTQEFRVHFPKNHETMPDLIDGQILPSSENRFSGSLARNTNVAEVAYNEGSSLIPCGQDTGASLASARSYSLPLTTLTFLKSKGSLSPSTDLLPACSSQPDHDPSTTNREHNIRSQINQPCLAWATERNEMKGISFANSQSLTDSKHFRQDDCKSPDAKGIIHRHIPSTSQHTVNGGTTLKELCSESTKLPSSQNVDHNECSSGARGGLSDIICAIQSTTSETEGFTRTENEKNTTVSEAEPERQEFSSGWVAWEDPVSGQKMYINLPSGNSSFLPPPCLEEQKELAKSPCLDLKLRNNYIPCGDSKSLLSRPQEERPQFRRESGQEPSSLVQLVQEWQNPVFMRSALQGIPEAGLYRKKDSVTASFSIQQPYKFTKEMMEHIKVIGQVDAKFIACLMPVYDSGMFKDDCLVVLFDQHAAHERVRLEQLLEGQYENFGLKRQIRSSSIKPHLELSLEPDVLRRAVIFQKELNQVGIEYKVKDSVIVLERLPTCLVERDNSQRQNGRSPTLMKHAKEILEEYTATLMTTRKSAIVLPKVMHDVLSSQACRGAIKFGSVLGVQECKKILEGLATCSLPFQCAHGRPSVAPVVDLRYLNDRRVLNKPNMSKLRKAVSSRLASSSCPI